MNKQDVVKFFKDVRTTVSKHSPEILTAVGIAGMITTTVLAVKATPKALKLIDDAEWEKAEKNEDSLKPLTAIETVKVAWKPYIPAAVTGVASIACLVGANSIHSRRNVAIATAYKLSETAFAEYKEKMIETIGEKKEKVVREQIAQDKVDKNPVSKHEVVFTGNGEVEFLEPVSMRYFMSDIETIRRIINDINYRMTSGMEEYISLSEFYDEIGLSHTAFSDDVGWNIGRDGQIRIDLPPAKDEHGRPCLVLDYLVEPRRDFMHLM